MVWPAAVLWAQSPASPLDRQLCSYAASPVTGDEVAGQGGQMGGGFTRSRHKGARQDMGPLAEGHAGLESWNGAVGGMPGWNEAGRMGRSHTWQLARTH